MNDYDRWLLDSYEFEYDPDAEASLHHQDCVFNAPEPLAGCTCPSGYDPDQPCRVERPGIPSVPPIGR